MIALHLLTGAAAGQRISPARFPVSVGRAASNSLAVVEPGVFDRHFEIQFTPDGFSLVPNPPATVSINGALSPAAILRNGDIIEAGFAKIQFWLGPMSQRSLLPREMLTWLMVGGVAAAQVYLLANLLAFAR